MPDVLPIVYLYPGCPWGGGSSRQSFLVEALAKHVPMVFLWTAPYARQPFNIKRPYAECVGSNITVIHNAMSLRTNRYWKRLGKIAGAIDGHWIKQVLRERGIKE